MRPLCPSLCLLFASFPVLAQLHDQGMLRLPSVKTEYVDPDAGTASDPLVLGTCLWGNCRPERLVFSQSNHWQQNLPCVSCAGARESDAYWTVLFNNEPRADPRNSGPPDASLPRSVPGTGIMGFGTAYGEDNFAGDTRWRAHLVLDLIGYSNPVAGGIPFLAFGEFSDRGNLGRPLGYLNPDSATHPSVLEFGARLWQAVPPVPLPGGTQPATLASYVYVVAKWSARPKAIFLTLFHYNIQNSVPPNDPATYRFNWPIKQSALYPGAEIVYIDAEDVDYYCGFDVPSLVLDQDVDYRIDLTALFSCVSDLGLFTEPLPATPDIPVIDALWANESSGLDGDLWTDVHDQRMVPAILPPAARATARGAQGFVPGATTEAIRALLASQCAAVTGCPARAALAAEGRLHEIELPIARQPSRPVLLRSVEPAR